MKTLSANLKTHLEGECTTLATCWRITRRDGKIFYFTDHDVDITYESSIYVSNEGYDRTAISGSFNYDTDELNLTGFFATSILESDVRAGLFDFSEVLIFLVNYEDLTQGDMILKKGTIGEIIITSNGIFNCELRGLTQRLSQRVLEKYQAECRADLGDLRCKIPVNPDLVVRSRAYEDGEYIKVITGNGSKLQYSLSITNWDFTALTGWTTVQGVPQVIPSNGGLSAYTGTNYLEGNTGDNYIIYQDIDLTADVNFDSAACDAGELFLDASLVVACSVDGERDATRFRILALDSSSLTIKSLWDTNYEVPLPNDEWQFRVKDSLLLPVGTRTLRVYCEGLKYTGALPNAGFDAIIINITDTNGASGGYEMFENRIYECTTAGTTSGTQPTYDTVVGNSTVDGTATFKCYEAWTRYAEVNAVTDNQVFNITVTESRAIDGWFDYGLLTFESGNNAGLSMDIKAWSRTDSDEITLFLPMPYDVQVGDALRLTAGCDKKLTTCTTKFDMSGSIDFDGGNYLNFRGEPYIAGRDRIIRVYNGE